MRSGSARAVAVGLAGLGLGLAMFAVSAVLAPPPVEITQSSIVDVTPPSAISALQDRLKRLPGDHGAWSALGTAYLDEAVATANPAYYSKAEGAFKRSLKVQPVQNAGAVTGQAGLAASRHDFSAALKLAKTSQRYNSYSAANQAVLVDALMELGQYDQAKVELQHMLDLKPSVPAAARVSYYRELHGDLAGAKTALDQAEAFASRTNDKAFIFRYLGELAFSTGDLATALDSYDTGLEIAPGNAALLAARAKARVAAGRTEEGLKDYQLATAVVPLPTTIADYASALRAAGRSEEAARQDALTRTTYTLQRNSGSNVDLELSLYEADNGNPKVALDAAQREYRRRASVHTEDALGWALHKTGDDEAALKHARAAENLSATNASFAYHRGMIEHSLGLKAAARKSLQRAMDINPYFSLAGAKQARQTLRELNR